MRQWAALLVIGVLVVEPAAAAVLCAKPRKGVLNGTVKVRQACRPGETQLAPEDVGFCCTAPSVTSTTSTSTTTVSCPIHTTTTLGIPDCFGSGSCGGLCPNARACVPDAVTSACGCTGPIQPCGVVTSSGLCGGSCPDGSTCQTYEPPLPNGCTDFPRCACVPD